MWKLIVLALVFAVLATFVYFYEIAGEEERKEEAELEESLLRLKEDDIRFREISRAGFPVIKLERVGERWFLEEPVQTPADQTTVSSLLSNLTTAKRARTFSNVDDRLEEYGLTEPGVQIQVRTADQVRTLLFGGKDFTGNELYVKLAEKPEVFVTAALILTSAQKEVIEWRDKSIVSFEQDQVVELRIVRGAEELTMAKKEDRWWLEGPINEPADGDTIRGLLSTLENGTAQVFVTERADELAQYGLDEPTVAVQLRTKGDDDWIRLEVGAQEEENFFARSSQGSAVFMVEKKVPQDLFQELWEFRAKEVVDVEQDNIATVAVHRDESEIAARREDYKWTIESPEEHRDREALAYKFWYPIDDIEFRSIDEAVETFPQPEIRVVVTQNDGTVRNFEFARRGEGYAARQVETGRQGEISEESFEKLSFDVEDITGELPSGE